ncbi:MAG: monothiol glutaredoxin, Grx4 family [Candidatus Marinimicrobia bacterium]|nr:monothiol glutaredoxin, Grx4 family [Candidatus Neomarinimicrobiota bacterium]|tara:strand:- start:615 stop:926 length:312 start_codon:yes stop_codon:yes gene_type:complete
MELKEEIINDISNNRIMLYMKGTKDQPMCGFSATIVKILNYYDVDFVATNVLENPNIRVELSKYSNWPTIPQLFVEGELIGGCDIALEMHQQGQLQSVLVKNS